MKRLRREKTVTYKGEKYRIQNVFTKRLNGSYYWAYHLKTKEFIIIHPSFEIELHD